MLINKKTKIHVTKYKKITEQQLKKLSKIDDLDYIIQKNIAGKSSVSYYIGDSPPSNTNTIWFDNSKSEFEEINDENVIIQELKTVIGYLNSKVAELDKKVKYLEYKVETYSSNEDIILTEDNELLLAESGKEIILEKSISAEVPTNTNNKEEEVVI